MLLAGVILILVIFALIGWRKGVIRLVLSLVSMIITIMAAVVIAPLATTAIKNNTNIDENIAQSIYTVLYENKEVDEYFEDKQVLTGGIDISQVESHIQTVTDVVAEVGDKINLPESLTEAVKAMPDSELMSVIREYGEASVKEITIRLIAFRLADIVLTAIAYLVIMVLSKVYETLTYTLLLANIENHEYKEKNYIGKSEPKKVRTFHASVLSRNISEAYKACH